MVADIADTRARPDVARAPEDIRRRIRWLPIGTAVQLTASGA
jgi:hypothetical protein